MARTDKDRPYWVTANETTVREHHRCHGADDICDINVPASAAHPYRRCHRDTRQFEKHWRFLDPVPQGARYHRYWTPERARTRQQLNKLRAKADSGFDVEESTTLTDQHRHTPLGGGWWD